jgi:NitT/TauT family transport system substrate-binding protein
VVTGQADIAFTDMSALVVARSQEMKVKTIAVINTLAPHCIIARRDRGINVLKDLEGKTFGGSKAEGIVIVLPTLCELAGVDFQKIKLVSVDTDSKDPLLFAGKVDAIGQFAAGGGSRWKRLAKEANLELAFFPYFNYGFKAYGLSLVASDKLIAEKPDVVRRFLAATMKGVAWALDNEEKTVKMFMGFRPEMDEQGFRDTFYDSRNLMVPGMHPNGLGWMEKDRVKYTVDVMIKTQNLKPVPVEETYTNDFLPRVKPTSK